MRKNYLWSLCVWTDNQKWFSWALCGCSTQYISINDKSVCDGPFGTCLWGCNRVCLYAEGFFGKEFVGIFTGGCCPDGKWFMAVVFLHWNKRKLFHGAREKSLSCCEDRPDEHIHCVGYNAGVVGFRDSGFVSGWSLPKFFQLNPCSGIFLCWFIFSLRKKCLMWTSSNST